MKKIAIITIIIISAFGLSAKDKAKPENSLPIVSPVLSGVVMDQQSGEKLVGVAVKIDGTDNICYTDFDGNFKFSDLKPGNYELAIEFISYKELKTNRISLSNNEVHEINIPLKQAD